MKKIFFLITLSILFFPSNFVYGQFGNNNLAILVAASNTANNTTVSVVEINKTTVNQSAIQTINISGTGDNAIRVSGSATSTLYASNSDDGTLFCFTGHNSTNTGVNANTLNPRAVVTINNAGTVTLATTYTGTSGNQTRSATSLNNSNWYIGDQGGFYTNSSTSASPTGNVRGIKSFGGTVYYGQASSTSGVIQVGTISAPSGGTATGLTGLSNNSSHQDFYFISSGENGSTYDILYVVSATSNTAGSIAKYSLVSGTWTANGSYTTSFGGFGLAAEKSGSGAYLYVTTGQGALSANSVRKLTDAAGYNTTINITDNIVLYTTATGTVIKGIAFAPQSAEEQTITTGTVTGAPFCITNTNSADGQVGYSATGSFSSATFTAYLSDASGSFSSPTSVGSTVVDGENPEGSIDITIPAGISSGTGYKIRIECDDPEIIGTVSNAFEVINGAKNVSGIILTPLYQKMRLNWTNPASCYDEVMIVAKEGSSISASPTGDGSSYTANSNFGSGTSFDGGFVVYKGSSSPQIISGLTTGNTYYFKFFTRNGDGWSDGIESSSNPNPVKFDEVLLPQYIQGLSPTNSTRVPFAYRMTIEGLTPNKTYRYINQLVNDADGPIVNGAGNPIYVHSTGNFVRTTSPSLTTAGGYGEFTTDASGNYTGWFITEPSGNARLTPGQTVYVRVRLNDGEGGIDPVTYLTSTNNVKVINFGTNVTANEGTGIRGVTNAPAKDFMFLYDNTSGSGRPLAGTFVEIDGTANTAGNSYVGFYATNVNDVEGGWGVIIPNDNAYGVRRIEHRKLLDGSIGSGTVTDADGVWEFGETNVNTVNPTGGTTPLVIPSELLTTPLAGVYQVGLISFNRITGKNIYFEKSVNSINDEISWIPMENGKVYEGNLYVKKRSNPELNFPEEFDGVYATLTAAIRDLNICGVSDAVQFVLVEETYSSGETFPITIDVSSSFTPDASNTVTIKPDNGINAIISGTSSSAIIKINGTDFVTINGYNGSGKGLTIQNNSAGASSSVIWIGSKTGNGAFNNTIRECIINGYSSSTTLAGVVISSGTTVGGTAEIENSNTSVFDNEIKKAKYGVLAVGPVGNQIGLDISNSIIGSDLIVNKMGYAGVSISNQQDANVAYNIIFGVLRTDGDNNAAGIHVGGTINGGSIYSNIIYDVVNSNVSGFAASGILLASSSDNTNLSVVNNSVSDVYSFGNSSVWANNGHGIRINSGGGYSLYFNSVNLGTNQTTDANSAALFIPGSGTGLNVVNNIFANSQTNGNRYSVYTTSGAEIFNTIDYNDYYSTQNVGFLTSTRATLSDWQSATGQDDNSISDNPLFTTSTNLQPEDYLSPVIEAGILIDGITSDILGITRHATTPSMGAYEKEYYRTFIGDGNLNVAGNWVGGLPSAGSNVSIRGNCVIPDKTNNTFFVILGNFKVQSGGSLNMTTYQIPIFKELVNEGYVQTQSKAVDPIPPNTNYGGTVEYNGVSKYIASNSTYNNLILSGTAAKAMTGDVTVNGVFTMDGTETLTGMQVKVNDNTLTINGSVNFVGLTKIGTTLGSSLVLGESVALREGLLPKNYISEETIRAHAEEYGDAEDNLVVTNEEDAEDAESLTANETPIVVEKRVRDNNTPEAVFELPAMKLGNLTVNRTDGVKMLGSITVDGTLSLLKGTFDFDAFKLTVNGAVNKTTGNWTSDGVNAAIIIGGTGETPVDIYAVNLKALTVTRPSGITLRGAVGVFGKVNLNGYLYLSGGSLTGLEDPVTSTIKTQILVGGSGDNPISIPPITVSALTVNRNSGASINSGTVNLLKKLNLLDGVLTVNEAATLNLGIKGTITRVSGSLSGTYTPDATVGLVYQGGSHINMGSEVPVGADVVMLTMGNTGGLTLNSNMSLNAALSITGGNFDIKNNTLTLGATKGSITETSGELISSTSNGQVVKEYNWKMMNDPTNVAGLGITVSSPKKLGLSTVTRGFTPLVVGEGDLGISRWYKIEPTVNTALNATIFFRYKDSELGEINEDDLALWLSTDDGASWTNIGGSVNTGANTISVSGVNQVGLITAASTFAMSASRNINVISFDASVSKKTVTFEVLTQDVTGDLFIEKLTTKEGETDSWTTVGQAEMVKTFEKENPDGNQVSTVQSFTFVENSVEKGIYQYRLKNVDSRGRVKYSENTIEVEVEGIPTEYALMQNYPNPFNPTTRIKYQLPLDGKVVIELYSVTGEKVADLVNSELTAGYYTLDVNAASLNLTSGVYIYRIVANNLETGDKFVSVKKMMLIK